MLTHVKLIRAARAAVGLSQEELAKEANLTPRTVGRLELGEKSSMETLYACQRVLEAHGVEFQLVNGRYGFFLPKN
jgi:transcriptional regulator with XRE-family HTH domain